MMLVMEGLLAIDAFNCCRHSGAREGRARNLEIPGSMRRIAPE
jgi:hypothetical protein